MKRPQIASLGQFRRRSCRDPRRTNRSFPGWLLLVFIAMAQLAGRDKQARTTKKQRELVSKRPCSLQLLTPVAP